MTFVGRLDPRKRTEDLLEAARAVVPRYPQVRVLVVGGADAYQPDYAQQIFDRYAGDAHVTFAGSRGDVPQILRASDILVLPAVGEGMSHVINEAGAAGLAVIATDDGAAREQLEGGAAGRLVPPGRPDLLAQSLIELVEDAGTRADAGRASPTAGAAALQRPAPGPEVAAAAVDDGGGRARSARGAHRGVGSAARLPVGDPDPDGHDVQRLVRDVPVSQGGRRRSRTSGWTTRLYDRLLEECAREPGLRRIEPFLMNEPFTDNRMIDWIARAKQRVPHAMVTVTTNGSPLVPKVIDRLVRSGLDAIWFSFNGATPETYEKIMGIPYARVKANLDYLLEVRPPTLQVFVNMIETKLMAPEIAENIRYWESRGVRAGVSPLVNRAGNVENYDELRYTPQAAQPVRTCELPFYKMYILASGDVVLVLHGLAPARRAGQRAAAEPARDLERRRLPPRSPPAHRGPRRRDRPVQGVLVHAVVSRRQGSAP